MKQHWIPVPQAWRAHACANAGSVLLESSLPSSTEHHSLLFTQPHQILTATSPDDLPALFAQIESALAQGQWAAGYMAYEAGTHFLSLPASPADGPLATFGIYSAPQTFNHHNNDAIPLPQQIAPLRMAPMPRSTVAQYNNSIHQIHEWIAAGDTYQVNYTMQLQSPYSDPPLDIYNALSAQQPSSYAAILCFPNQPAILSFSPELFFRVDGDGVITTKPMKGTTPRGSTPQEDQHLARALQHDEKNRAEHVMIVDLLRNDLNRICRTGTVHADDLFHIEQYETLHQMTSRVSGRLQPNTPWYEVFRALFPGGSITGAPKRHTAKLIQNIEQEPRGVYTGAIGYFAPNHTATFNIAIRTAVLQAAQKPCHPERSEAESKDLHSSPSLQRVRTTGTSAFDVDGNPERNEAKQSEVEGPAFLPSLVQASGILTLGVGGGIVADSNASSEYNEALLKADFVRGAAEPYQLIETMRAQQGTIAFLDAHLERLASSAQALGFSCNTKNIRDALAMRTDTGRVRLLLHRTGHFDMATSEAPTWPAQLHLVISTHRTHATSPHLRHKTTFRPEYSSPPPAGFHDTLFQNTRGEITESAIANLLVYIDGRWCTPPLASGVLPGIMRAHLLQTEQIVERVISLQTLKQSIAAALCNALRGIAPITSLELSNAESIRWHPPSSLPAPRIR